MTPSPRFTAPEGMEGKSLAMWNACGCLTAALAVHESTTQKDVREFYDDAGSTGREVRWTSDDVIRARLFRDCEEQHGV